MRRSLRLTASAMLITAMLLPVPVGTPAHAQDEATPSDSFLFGSWTGGLFPAPTDVNAATCLAQPVVIFTRDLVLRASVTEQTYTQRVVDAVRRTDDGFEFRFEPGGGGQSAGAAGVLGLPAAAEVAGFGCESNDVLHVQRRGDNEITFPGCSDFPNPLVRCPGR